MNQVEGPTQAFKATVIVTPREEGEHGGIFDKYYK